MNHGGTIIIITSSSSSSIMANESLSCDGRCISESLRNRSPGRCCHNGTFQQVGVGVSGCRYPHIPTRPCRGIRHTRPAAGCSDQRRAARTRVGLITPSFAASQSLRLVRYPLRPCSQRVARIRRVKICRSHDNDDTTASPAPKCITVSVRNETLQ